MLLRCVHAILRAKAKLRNTLRLVHFLHKPLSVIITTTRAVVIYWLVLVPMQTYRTRTLELTQQHRETESFLNPMIVTHSSQSCAERSSVTFGILLRVPFRLCECKLKFLVSISFLLFICQVKVKMANVPLVTLNNGEKMPIFGLGTFEVSAFLCFYTATTVTHKTHKQLFRVCLAHSFVCQL